MNNFQRNGAISNTAVGSAFEAKVQAFFAQQGLNLQPHFKLNIGVHGRTKPHSFDLGCKDKKVIVECKSHTWTETGNMPSAKMANWNQAMYYFHAASTDYRKILFVLRHFSTTRSQTLAEYYIKTNRHLIPDGVEIWELDENNSLATKLNLGS